MQPIFFWSHILAVVRISAMHNLCAPHTLCTISHFLCPLSASPDSIQLSAEFYKCTVTVCTVLFAVARTSGGKMCFIVLISETECFFCQPGVAYSVFTIYSHCISYVRHIGHVARVYGGRPYAQLRSNIRHTNRNKAKNERA